MSNDTPEFYAQCLPYLVDKASVYLRLRGAMFLSTLNKDVTFEQFIALDAIANVPDLCQRDLAKILLKDRSNVTRILSILESKGMITRAAAVKQNRPVKILKITRKGQDFIDKYSPTVKAELDEFLSGFDSEELQQFKTTLEKIVTKISENVNIQI